MTQEQFNILTRPLYGKMYACANMLMRDSDAAADCVQDALVSLWQQRQRLKEIENPEGYCLTTVKRRALDMLRHNSRLQMQNIEVCFSTAASDASPHEKTEIIDELRMAEQLLNRLAPRQRDVVTLSAFQGLDNSEIAQATGLSDENVRVLLSRGRSRIRELFRKLHK